VVLAHLQVEGGHKLTELACDPPEVLGLQLSRQELNAVLESCRRRGFIVRLDPSSGSGPVTPGDEWVVNAEGRRATRPAIPWFLGHAGRVSMATLTAAASLIGILGISLTLGRDAKDSVGGLAFVLVSAFVLVMWIVALLRDRSNGARGRRIVASDWSRWKRERPGLYAKAFKRFPWRWLSLAIATLVIAIAVVVWTPGLDEDNTALMLVFGPPYLLMIPVFFWSNRWNEIESWGRNQRTDAIVAETLSELNEAEGRVSQPVAYASSKDVV